MNLLYFKVLCIFLFFLVNLVSGCRSLGVFSSGISGDFSGTENTLEQPFQALDNLDPRIREMGAFALGRLTPIKNHHMETYIKSLDLTDDEKTMKAIEEMGELATNMGPVVEALVNSTHDYDSRVRFEALASLKLIFDQLVVIVGPLNELENIYANEKDQIVKASEKTMGITNDLNGKITNANAVALKDPIRKIRKMAEKFMVKSKEKPQKFFIAGVMTSADVKVEEQPQAVIKTDEMVSDGAKTGEKIETVEQTIEKTPGDTKVEEQTQPVMKTEEKTPESATIEEQPQVVIKSEEKVAEDVKIIEKQEPVKPEPEKIATPDPTPEITDKIDEESEPSKNINRFLKQLESFELANRRFALLAMAPYIEKELSPVEETIGSVKKGDIALRIEAADSIVERADRMEEVVAALCHATEDVDTDMRTKSLKNLGNILSFLSGALNPFEKAPKEIEDVLTKEKAEVEHLVRIQIDQFKKSSEEGIEKISQLIVTTVPFFLNALDDKVLEVRNAAGEGLRSILSRSEEITPLNPVWEKVFQKVKLTPDDIKIRLLMNDLKNPGVDVARAAARSISEMGALAKNAVPSLIKVIRNRENLHVHYKYVQMDAMAALGSMGAIADEAVPALMDQLGDIRFEIRSSAVLALGRIGGKNGTAMILEMLEKDKSSLVRESAAQALSNMDPAECVEKVYVVLFKALKDSSNDIRLNAFTTLAAYELLNRGAGIIMWKSSDKNVNGYQVCTAKGKVATSDCMDTGMSTIFRLGDFKSIPREGKGIEVKALFNETVSAVEFKYIDIMSLLEKSASSETNPGLKEKKNKALLELMKNLINKGNTKKTD
ncbi:MAG: HEAT repeat domain-containing protein [Desulfobacteraceae bacterium]